MNTKSFRSCGFVTCSQKLIFTALVSLIGISSALADHKTVIDTLPWVIDAPGKYVLAKDLSFASGSGPAITITADHVELDLKGHGITGDGSTSVHDYNGILVAGSPDDSRHDVEIENGFVIGFHFGVWLTYTTDSEVEDMTLSMNSGGIGLNASSDNEIEDNVATQNSSVGILLQQNSDDNEIEENDCNANRFQGIFLDGRGDDGGCDDNKIEKNTCNDNGVVGIWLNTVSSGNRIEKNRVMRNNTLGVVPNGGIGLGHPSVSTWLPMDNKIEKNKVFDNATGDPLSFDVFDNNVLQTGDCANRWRKNHFDIDGEVGDDAGPKEGCIR